MTDNEKPVLFHMVPSRGMVARWMLEEVGVPYDLRLLDGKKGENRGADYLALNPMGKVPALRHRGVLITENPAICAYLADAFPDANLAPAIDDPRRGTYYRWLFFAHGCIEPAVIDKAFERPPVQRGALGYGSYEDVFDTLEAALAPGPWLLGEHFTAADVIVGGQVAWGLQFGTVEKRAAFVEYAARLAARPAHQRQTALDGALMAAAEEAARTA